MILSELVFHSASQALGDSHVESQRSPSVPHSRRRSLALAPAAAFATTSPDLGKPAPLFTAVDSNGKTWSLADLKGKVVVLETTNHDCPYVRKHYNAKNMQTQQREAAAKGVVWLTSASNATGEQGYVTPAQANDLTKSRDAAPAAVLLDPQSKIARAYGATVTPHMYIIDAKGILVYKGGIDFDPVVERRRRSQGQAVCPRRPGRGDGRQAGHRSRRRRPMAAR